MADHIEGNGEAGDNSRSGNFAGAEALVGGAYDLSKVLDLQALGLKPGDELYFYCKARDNHGQGDKDGKRIALPADTAQLRRFAGDDAGTDVKPEFFRSERQIIIETEQL